MSAKTRAVLRGIGQGLVGVAGFLENQRTNRVRESIDRAQVANQAAQINSQDSIGRLGAFIQNKMADLQDYIAKQGSYADQNKVLIDAAGIMSAYQTAMMGMQADLKKAQAANDTAIQMKYMDLTGTKNVQDALIKLEIYKTQASASTDLIRSILTGQYNLQGAIIQAKATQTTPGQATLTPQDIEATSVMPALPSEKSIMSGVTQPPKEGFPIPQVGMPTSQRSLDISQPTTTPSVADSLFQRYPRLRDNPYFQFMFTPPGRKQ